MENETRSMEEIKLGAFAPSTEMQSIVTFGQIEDNFGK